MKKLLVLAALTVAAAPAMASKARVTALGNASHLIDTQTMFTNSADIHYLGDFATIEFGGNNDAATTTASGPATPRAEGGFVRSSSMGKWGAYLGRQSTTVNEFVTNANTSITGTKLLKEQNPLDLMYGTELAGHKWGFGLHYSAAKKESTTQEVNTLGVSAGVRNDVWDAFVRIGLGGETKTSAVALKQKGLYDLGFGYWIDSMYVSAKYLTTKGTTTAGTTDVDGEKTQYSLGVVENMKVDGGNFFYGASYASNESKSGSSKTTTTGLPFIVGMEIDAASWMVLRGSLTQNVLLSDSKTETSSSSTTDKMVNNTSVAAGVGIKFNKFILDATLVGSDSNGQVDADTLLGNAALTYNF